MSEQNGHPTSSRPTAEPSADPSAEAGVGPSPRQRLQAMVISGRVPGAPVPEQPAPKPGVFPPGQPEPGQPEPGQPESGRVGSSTMAADVGDRLRRRWFGPGRAQTQNRGPQRGSLQHGNLHQWGLTRPVVLVFAGAVLLAAVVAVLVVWIQRPRPEAVAPAGLAEIASTRVPSGTVPTDSARASAGQDGGLGSGGPPSGGPHPGDPRAKASGQTAAPLVISVVGKVHDPGLVHLPPGSRVADAMQAAGGSLPGTEVTSVNLARRLNDGEQVWVGVDPPQAAGSHVLGGAPTGGQAPVPGAQQASGAAGAAGPAPQGEKVSINTANAQQLQQIHGVGPATAAKILQWRNDNGRFTSVEQLLEISGIGDATLEEMRPGVRL